MPESLKLTSSGRYTNQCLTLFQCPIWIVYNLRRALLKITIHFFDRKGATGCRCSIQVRVVLLFPGGTFAVCSQLARTRRGEGREGERGAIPMLTSWSVSKLWPLLKLLTVALAKGNE